MKRTMNWQAYRTAAEDGEMPEVKTLEVLALLDARDAAIKALQDIIAECPRPTKPYGKRVVDIAKVGIKTAQGI